MSNLRVLEFVRHDDGVWNLPAEQAARLAREFPEVRFDSPASRAEADGLLPGADAVFGWAVRRENFASARRLRWIQVPAAGIGSLTFPELAESDVVVTNARGLHARSMAEHTIGVMLAFARKLHLARDAQHEARWAQRELWVDPPPITELDGSSLGLVGLGAVGSAIARLAKALGVTVRAVRRHPSSDPSPADEQWGPERLHELIGRSDWLVLAAPLTAATRRMIGRDEISRLRGNAIVINIGRGGLIDEPALIEALREGRLAGAALDVFADEPLPAESPLWRMPQVIVTPHVSGLGTRYWDRIADLFAGNLARFLAGRPLENVVDKWAGY